MSPGRPKYHVPPRSTALQGPPQGQDLPEGAYPSPGLPEGLVGMFVDYDKHGFRGGNPPVLQAILQRQPRTVADFIASLGTEDPASLPPGITAECHRIA